MQLLSIAVAFCSVTDAEDSYIMKAQCIGSRVECIEKTMQHGKPLEYIVMDCLRDADGILMELKENSDAKMPGVFKL